jgi:hypothetical protein
MAPRGGQASQRSASDKEKQELLRQHLKNIVELLGADHAENEGHSLAVATGQARSRCPAMFPNVHMQLQALNVDERGRTVLLSPK